MIKRIAVILIALVVLALAGLYLLGSGVLGEAWDAGTPVKASGELEVRVADHHGLDPSSVEPDLELLVQSFADHGVDGAEAKHRVPDPHPGLDPLAVVVGLLGVGAIEVARIGRPTSGSAPPGAPGSSRARLHLHQLLRHLAQEA